MEVMAEQKAASEDTTRHEMRAAGIENPFLALSKDEVLQDVDRYAREYDLDDILPLLQKGALVARNPADFETMTELDDTDRQYLREEISHRWKRPWSLYSTIIMNSIAAAIQGWDQTGSNGANLTFSTQFGLPQGL